MHARREHKAKGIERHRRPIVILELGPHAGQDELEWPSGLADQRKALNQGPEVCRGWVQGNQDQIGDRKQIGVDGTNGGGRIDEEVRGARLAERANPVLPGPLD